MDKISKFSPEQAVSHILARCWEGNEIHSLHALFPLKSGITGTSTIVTMLALEITNLQQKSLFPRHKPAHPHPTHSCGCLLLSHHASATTLFKSKMT